MPTDVPEPGSPAPEFTLISDQGAPVSLADLRGQRVVLFFYPKAMTGGCTVQARMFSDAQEDLTVQGAVVFGISPDTPDRLVKFRDKESLNFRLLSDPDHAVADRYGVWGPKSYLGKHYEGIHRSLFVIDEKGHIVTANPKVSPTDSVPQALAALKELA